MTEIKVNDNIYYYQIKPANPKSVKFHTIFHNQQFSEFPMIVINIYDTNKTVFKSTIGFTTTSLLSDSNFIDEVEIYVTNSINEHYKFDTKPKSKSTNKRKSKTKLNDKQIENEDLI